MPEVEFVDGPQRFLVGAETTLRLFVNRPDEQEVTLSRGWNLVSTYIDPLDPRVDDILGAVVERGRLVIAKDGRGRFWWPAQNYNGLGEWDVLQGYMIKVTADESFTAVGRRVPPDTAIVLVHGWNMIAYLLDRPVDSRIALGGVLDHIEIAKDGAGRFMVPSINYFGMGDMEPGQGYKLRMAEQVPLVYQQGDRIAVYPAAPTALGCASTGGDMSLLVRGVENIRPSERAEVIVRSALGGEIVGRAPLTGVPCGVIVRGDDPTTPEPDGAREGDRLTLQVLDRGNEVPVRTDVITGALAYHEDGLTVVDLLSTSVTVPDRLMLAPLYPNPFNGPPWVKFGLPEASDVRLTIHGVDGRVVWRRRLRNLGPGWHRVQLLNVSSPSGVYILEAKTGRASAACKIALVR